MKVLVVFGSKSDEHVFNEIAEELARNNASYEVRVCSAHRTPDELLELLKGEYAVIVTGAGLAAHLPGVVASKVIRPIIGVPVRSNFEGLDSLLSIMQMPPGIPVLATGVDQGRIAGKMASLMLREYKKVHLFGDPEEKAFKKAVSVLDDFGVPYEANPEFMANSLNIRFVSLDEQSEGDDGELVISVPLVPKEDDKALAALNVLKRTEHGLWVGLNRGENAALAAVKILNLHGAYTEKILSFRKKQAAKVNADDASVRG